LQRRRFSLSREKSPASEDAGYSNLARSNFIPETLAQIFRSGIRENRHDDGALIRPERRCYSKTSLESGGGARAQEQSLFPRGPLDQAIRLFRSNLQIGIGKGGIINARHNRRRHMLPPLQSMKGSIRLQADAANRGI